MPKQKSNIAFAPVYLDGNKKKTLSPRRVEKETHDGVETSFEIPNETTGKLHPFNRRTKRYFKALKRKRA